MKETEVKPDPELMKGKIFIDDIPGLEVSAAFRVDKTADKNNVIYGSIYKMHVAKHHSVGYSCLGNKPGEAQYYGKSSKNKREKYRYYLKENRIKDNEHAVLDLSKDVLKVREPQFPKAEFVSVGKVNEEGEKSETNPLGVYDAATEQYLKGIGGASSSGVQEVRIYKDTRENVIRKRMEELNGKLRENPQDIDTWIELVRFQDEAQGTELQSESYQKLIEEHKSRKQDLMVLEIKAAILKKAIEANPKCIRLKLFQLEVSKDTWEPEKLTEEWRNLVFVHINDVLVWQHYLLFVQSQFKQFTIAKIIKVYAKCLSSLQSLVDGTLKSHECQPGTKEAMLGMPRRKSISKCSLT